MWGAQDITVRFGDTPALDRVSLGLVPGAVTAIVGGDGAGKSTLLRALIGRVALADGSVSVPPLRDIGYQPSSSGIWRHLTVDENIAFVGRAYGLAGDALERRRQEVLGRTGLLNAGDRLGGQLSGGMRQKLGVCLALLHEPRLLLLDEPTTGVDPVSRVELWQMIADAAVAGTTIAMATTYLDEAERANQVLVLDRGRMLATGTARAIIGSVPGAVTASATRPGHDPARTWRRGAVFHTWHPAGTDPGAAPLAPDMEDAVIVLTLARESAGQEDRRNA